MVYSKSSDKKPEKICKDSEFCQKILQRDDIFSRRSDNLLIYIELTCIFFAIVTGCIFRCIEFMPCNPDFFEKINTEKNVKFIGFISTDEYCKCFDIYCYNSKSYGGDPSIQKTGKGLLDIKFKNVKQNEVSSNHSLAKGGYSNEIETILFGPGGLTSGENGSIIRGDNGIGNGTGYRSGFNKSVTRHFDINHESSFNDSLHFSYFFAKYGFKYDRALIIKNTGEKNIEGKWVLKFDLLKPMYWKPENNPEITFKVEDWNPYIYRYTFTVEPEILPGETFILEGTVQGVFMLDFSYYIVNVNINSKVPYSVSCEE